MTGVDPGAPMDPADVAAQLDAGQPDPQAVAEPDQPDDPLSRLVRLVMAPSPPPRQAGELIADDITWDMYINSAVQGMTRSDGMPAGVMLLIGVLAFAQDQTAAAGPQQAQGQQTDIEVQDGEAFGFDDVAE